MPDDKSNLWMLFAFLTVACWGLYGIFIHTGVMAFDPKADPNARYKAFLFVGLAYFLIQTFGGRLELVWGAFLVVSPVMAVLLTLRFRRAIEENPRPSSL